MLEKLYDVIQKVYGEMNQEFNVPLDSITEETKLDTLGIDSLTFVMIMLKIEEYFGKSIVVDDNKVFVTVKDVIEAIEG